MAIDVNLGPMLLKRRLASLFLAAVLAFPSATALAQSAEEQERIAASFVLALGRTPTAVEIERWAKQEPLSLADLVARHRRQLQGDAATERAVIVKASQDAFGVAPGEDDIKSLSGGGTYADLGYAADHIGILLSFIVPLVCYLYIIHYGLKGHQAGAAATGSR